MQPSDLLIPLPWSGILLILKQNIMTLIFFTIIASLILCLNFNLISFKKYDFKSLITNTIDLVIVYSLLFFSIKLTNYSREDNIAVLLLILIFTSILVFYFSFLRKLLHQVFLAKEIKIIRNKSIYIGNFTDNIKHIPFYNNFLISKNIYDKLNEDDLINLTQIYSKNSINLLFTTLNYVIPATIFYVAFELIEGNKKFILTIIAASSFVLLKKIFKKFKSISNIENKEKSKESLIKLFEILKKGKDKYKKTELDISLKNKIQLIEKSS